MDQDSTSLTVKISGKNQRGEQFQEVARLEPFGNFGVLIHTLQPLDLGDVMHVTGSNGKPIASAEVIWVRGGDAQAVEILLHRNTNIEEVVSVNESVTPAKTAMLPSLSSGATKPLSINKIGDTISTGKTAALTSNSLSNSLSGISSTSIKTSEPTLKSSSSETLGSNDGSEGEIVCSSCSKANPVTNKSCKFCGSYLSRGTSTLRSSTLSKIVEEVKAANATSNTNTNQDSIPTKSGATTSLSSKATTTKSDTTTPSIEMPAPSSAVKRSRSSSSGATKVSSKNNQRLNALAHQQKIALVALVLFSVLCLATFLPIGASLEPTSLDVVEQTGCVHVSALKRQTANIDRTGELEYWTQDKGKTAISFVKKQITAGNAGVEVENLVKTGAEIHGYWCPKAESKLVTKAQLPKTLAGLWTFNPSGDKSKDAGSFSLQLVDRTLVVKEKIAQTEVDRTKDIKQATYFTGQQKLTIMLDSVNSTKVNAATLKEITFHMPSSQEPLASAEGLLTNTVRPFYTGDYKDASSQMDLKQILMYVFGGLAVLSLAYLGFNFYQMKSM